MATARVTMIKSGRNDVYGLPLVVGTTYTLDYDFGNTLWMQGFALDTDRIFAVGGYPGVSYGEDGRYMILNLVTLMPEQFGSSAAIASDATNAVLAALATSGGAIALYFTPGKTYNFTGSITLPVGTTLINCNGATFQTQYGTAYSTPLFQNNKTSDISQTLILNDPVIKGNCVAIDMRYSADNPGAGLSLMVKNFDQNTMDGNRRSGTASMVLSHMDFLDVTKTKTYNVDQVMVLGAAPPKRNSTQLTLRNIMAGQVNGGVLFRGCDKVNIIGADIANCNNGFSFEGNNNRIYLNQCHVEGLARSGYSTKSSYVHASSQNVGYNFVDDVDNRVILSQCSLIDLATSGGGATHGVRLGVSSYPGITDIEFEDCTFPETCEGSASFKPFRGYAPFKWTGKWTFTDTSEMVANGLGYLDHNVQDSDNNYAPKNNLLGGTTVLSLRTYVGGAAPTITEVAQSYSPQYISHRILFNSIGFQRSTLNLPVGWCTLDVVGQRIAGNVLLRVEQNGSPFTQLVNIQYKSLNDTFHRTRICFYNPTPNQSYNVGLASQNASGDESVFSYIACYAGLPDADIRVPFTHVVGALPAASARWRYTEMIVSATGVIDKHYRCTLAADGTTYAWQQITLV